MTRRRFIARLWQVIPEKCAYEELRILSNVYPKRTANERFVSRSESSSGTGRGRARPWDPANWNARSSAAGRSTWRDSLAARRRPVSRRGPRDRRTICPLPRLRGSGTLSTTGGQTQMDDVRTMPATVSRQDETMALNFGQPAVLRELACQTTGSRTARNWTVGSTVRNPQWSTAISDIGVCPGHRRDLCPQPVGPGYADLAAPASGTADRAPSPGRSGKYRDRPQHHRQSPWQGPDPTEPRS